MDNKIVSIGSVNKNSRDSKFKRHIQSNFTQDNLKREIENMASFINYDPKLLLSVKEEVDRYFESGSFYNSVFQEISDGIGTNDCRLVTDPFGTKMFIYKIEIKLIIGMSDVVRHNRFLIDAIAKYAFRTYKNEGYKQYLLDVFETQNMGIQFMEIYIQDKDIYMGGEIKLLKGELYDKMYHYYELLGDQ